MPDIFDKRSIRLLAFLALFTSYCATLMVLRIVWTGQGTFRFLLWNLFLAWMPILFSSFTQYFHQQSTRSGRLARWSLLLAVGSLVPWLLFLPNAPYILTDLVHLRPRAGVPYWFDILLIASFAFNGMLLGFFSLTQVHDVLVQRLRPLYAWAIILLASIGSGYGIYLGRVQRWNSWDILRHPLRLAVDCLRPWLHPFAHKEALVMTAILAGFFFLGYLVFHGLADNRDGLRVKE